MEAATKSIREICAKSDARERQKIQEQIRDLQKDLYSDCMAKEFQDKVVLITGAASGIGYIYVSSSFSFLSTFPVGISC